MLSVVLPSYNEQMNIEHTAFRIKELLEEGGIAYEMVFVDDGSSDDTWNRILSAQSADANIRGIKLSRNFGKEAAIYAGLAAAKGDCVVVMDCDLQHPPEKILDMYQLWEEGFEVIEGVKADRGSESALHRHMANVFYRIISKATDFDLQNASDFKLLDRIAVDSLLMFREKDSFFRALSSWIGFRTATVPYEVTERNAGMSSWDTRKLMGYAISNIMSFTTIPLQLVTVLGIAVFVFGVCVSTEAVAATITGNGIEGFTTVLILCSFIGSAVMVSMGIMGLYIGKIYEEVKGRPKYIISKIAESAK